MRQTLTEHEGRDVRNEEGIRLLSRLNEAIYDSEDVLQDCQIYAKRRRLGDPGCAEQVRLPLCSFLNPAFRIEIAQKIQKIIDEIEEVLPEIRQLLGNPAAGQGHETSATRTDIYYGISSHDIVGLGNEIAELENVFITQSNGRIEHNVYAITGMPGIGKTALAKMVYNSPNVCSHFPTRIWLHVTKRFQTLELLKSIAEQIIFYSFEEGKQMNYSSYEGRTEAYLFHLVENLVRKNRLLLVLDDCWSDAVWTGHLRTPFSKAAEGSAVVITTRKRGLASSREFLKASLSPEDGWELLRQVVSGDHRNDTNQMEDVGKVGEEIVLKCGGVPLAIKVIGGVLKSKRLRDWETICSSGVWDTGSLPENIRPALLLSYMDLPFRLTRCFSHCSLFPENFTFYRQALVQLWMAEGLVDTESQGTDCYGDLISRNLLTTEISYYDDIASRMRPSLHAFASYVSSSQFRKLNDSSDKRRLYRVDKKLSVVPSIEEDQAFYLRSLVLSKNPIKRIDGGYFEKLSRLRVLDLSYTGIEKLPHSVGSLLQLRLLDLSHTRLKELPESITRLTELQSLQLLDSNSLVDLPRGLTELTKLRCLTVGGKKSRLNSLPPGIGQLRELRRLLGFLVNADICNMGDLENLSSLTELTLHKLDRVGSPGEAQRAVLRNKVELAHLRLSCNSGGNRKNQSASTNNIERVFENLRPPPNCISIHIDGYSGLAFPSWMMTLPFRHLEWLRLENCKFCRQLPPLGRLPRLKVLDIRDNSVLTEIGSEFTGTLKFPSLEELYLISLDKLQEWSGFGQGAFPRLKKLEIVMCAELKHLSSDMRHLTSLGELTIAEAKKLEQIKDFPSVRKLCIRRNRSLTEVSHMPEVNFINIRRCGAINNIRCLKPLAHLALSDDKMNSLPAWLTQLTSMKRLDLEVNKSLFVRIYNEKFEFDKFQHIQQVKIRCYVEDRGKADIREKQCTQDYYTVKDSDLYVLYTKDPYSFTSNLAS